MKSKKHEELEKINLFKSFMEVIIKDGTDLYNGFGIAFSQCISHIQIYLKGIYDFVNHTEHRKMADFFTKYNNYRNELIQKGKKKFDEREYNNILKEYEDIINLWKKEWMEDKNNPVKTNQRNIKMKQKIGKFRSNGGAEVYAIIRSYINTYKKQGINVYHALIQVFKNETIIA